MTLQPPSLIKPLGQKNIQPQKAFQRIYCHDCGAEVKFHKDKLGPKGKKIPLDPCFNYEPHMYYCMYLGQRHYDPDTEPMLHDFMRLISRTRIRRVIGATGQAR